MGEYDGNPYDDEYEGKGYYGDDECGNRPANIIHGWVKSNPPAVLAADAFGKYVSRMMMASVNMSRTYLQLSSTSQILYLLTISVLADRAVNMFSLPRSTYLPLLSCSHTMKSNLKNLLATIYEEFSYTFCSGWQLHVHIWFVALVDCFLHSISYHLGCSSSNTQNTFNVRENQTR